MCTHTPRTLLLGSKLLPSAGQLASAAIARGWHTAFLDADSAPTIVGNPVYYGGTDRVEEYATQYNLNLVNPPLDLLARMPTEFTARVVRFGTLASIAHLRGPMFIKPADPIRRVFDAGVHSSGADVRSRRPLDPATPVLVSEVVEWTSEFRCFIANGRVCAWSPYVSYGRPTWKPGSAGEVPANLEIFCNRLMDAMRDDLPAAFVVDVGVLQDGRWAIVEFNPAWCSGILGADPAGVLEVLGAATSITAAGCQ